MAKNPKRVAAGKRNRAKRKELSDETKRRLRDAALKNKPWKHSTGPRTIAGKARSALNRKRNTDTAGDDLVSRCKHLLKDMGKIRRTAVLDVETASVNDGSAIAESLYDLLVSSARASTQKMVNDLLEDSEKSIDCRQGSTRDGTA